MPNHKHTQPVKSTASISSLEDTMKLIAAERIRLASESSRETASAIHTYNSYGISQHALHHNLINSFNLPDEYRAALDYYFVLHWTTEYVISQIQEGCIIQRGVRYLVVYSRCTPAILASSSAQVRLSFRKCRGDIAIPPYVIVQLKPAGNGATKNLDDGAIK